MLKSPLFMGGKMIKLETLENRVKTVLTNHPEARDDDMKLYFIVCQECFYKTHHITEISFKEFIYNYRELGCPSFESVRRTRQKIQAKHPELGCSPEMRRKRSKCMAVYRKYAKDKEVLVSEC